MPDFIVKIFDNVFDEKNYFFYRVGATPKVFGGTHNNHFI